MTGAVHEDCEVRFKPDDKTVLVACGTSLAAAAARAGVFIALPCGGRGTCGKCRVRLLEGQVSEITDAERDALSEEELAAGFRLACRTLVLGPATAEVPQASRALDRKEISLLRTRRFQLEPAVRNCVVKVDQASLEDQRSDLDRLRAALGQEFALPCSLWALRRLPAAIRASGRATRVTASNSRIVHVTPASEPDGVYGAAVDLGTTTVVGYLFDLEEGRYLASAASYNPQVRHGADVISRINHAISNSHGLGELHEEAVGVVNDVITQAAAQAKLNVEDIFEVVLVGNTCMHHLFLGIDPRHLGQSPYVASVRELVNVEARDLGLTVHPSANVVVLPVIAGFVGADTVGLILASELTDRDYSALAIDIGTNGEVALWNGQDLLVASCAAGPAFEGAQIKQGTRAIPGAIERVEVRDGDLLVHTIGDLPAVGICGSGLFDAVAVLLELGALDAMGRFSDGKGLSEKIAARMSGEGPERRVTLADAQATAEGSPVVLTQGDVRQVQLAKGAVRAAVELLLAEAGLRAEELGEVLLAGAFGNYVNPHSILRFGLLPRAVPEERVHGVGNAAGAGAALALLSVSERRRAEAIADRARHVELFTSTQFQEVFADAMLFV